MVFSTKELSGFCCSFEAPPAWAMTVRALRGGLWVRQARRTRSRVGSSRRRSFCGRCAGSAVPISYRDLERMFSDRGIQVDHTTLFRWIQAYAPELEKRIRPHLQMTNGS